MAAKGESFPTQTGDLGHRSAAQDHSTYLEAASGDPVVLPDGKFLSDASYLQQGDDLVLIGPDGATFVVRGYFLLDNPPDLISPDGGRMTAAMVQSGSASSGELSRKLVDVCIYDQYRQQGDSKGIAKRCQCAVRKAAPSLNAKEVSRLQLGAPLTGSVRAAVYQGIAACQ